MAEKIPEKQVANLLEIMRSDALAGTKVQHINSIKSGIKHANVPDISVAPLFEVIHIAMSSQHTALANAGLSTLHHTLVRLTHQEPRYIKKEAARILPLIIVKAGDEKDKHRQLATQCLTTIWRNKATSLDVERSIKEDGLTGKKPSKKTKLTMITYIAQMHRDHGMQFKGFVTSLMELLKDADELIRQTARDNVIELFRNASNAAKADLRKQLKIANVAPSILEAIEGEVAHSAPADNDIESTDTGCNPDFVSSMTSIGPRPPMTETKLEHVEASYVHTQRELEELFTDMHAHFEGKETEGNWLKREQSCTKIRRLNAGNAPNDFHDAFFAGIKALLDGILKAVNSLRTSLSKEGCSVIQDIAMTFGSGLDSMVVILLPSLIKLCAGTKKISSQQGNATVEIIISKVPYSGRIMQPMFEACHDKNIQPRLYATGWLKILLTKEAHLKSQVEHAGGLKSIEKCLEKGLTDAQPEVRENMRSTYWAFAQIWPANAESIMAKLAPKQQEKLLESGPNNPNSPQKSELNKAGMSFSKSTSGFPKPSLKDVVAQKKAAIGPKNLLARPGSAMSSFAPVRTVSSSSSISTKSDTAPAKRPEGAAISRGGLSVAPMRPPPRAKRAAEIARPATAGPYSVRGAAHAISNSDSTMSPTTSTTQKPRTPSASSTTSPPKRGVARSNISHSSQSTSYISPVKASTSRTGPSPPKASPVRSKSTHLLGTSPTKANEELTMVVPALKRPSEPQSSSPSGSSEVDGITTPPNGLKIYEDSFSSKDDQTTPRPLITAPVLAEVPINEDASNISRTEVIEEKGSQSSPERLKQNSRLLDSGITKIKAKSLDGHGFRKLQGMIRDNKAEWDGDRFDVLLLGLFDYLEAPLAALMPEKAQDVKAQILGTIRLMHKKDANLFRPYVSRGLQSILVTRSLYDSQSHLVSGLEIFAKELITLASARESIQTLTTQLQNDEMSVEGCRRLSMGLHVLKDILDTTALSESLNEEVDTLGRLVMRCLDSSESKVRMDAVLLCVSVHARVGESRFWEVLGAVKDDSKGLLTYYVATKGQPPASR